jgi:beta-galactosidase
VVLARYCDDFYAGKPAITLNRYGAGSVIYAGVLGEAGLFERLAKLALSHADLQPNWQAPAGVEIAERWQDGRRLTFILNHSTQNQQIRLEQPYLNLLGDVGRLQGTVMLPSKEVWILTEVQEVS